MIADDWAGDVGVFILRVVLGATMAAHGFQKFFGGGRILGTARWFDSIGMKPGGFHALIAATTEIAAGLGLALGLLTPASAAAFVALMLVAAWTVHRPKGFFIVREGWEYNLVLAAGAVAVATVGPGRLSLDYVLFHTTGLQHLLSGWWGLFIALAIGVSFGVVQLASFYRPPMTAANPSSTTQRWHERTGPTDAQRFPSPGYTPFTVTLSNGAVESPSA